MLVSSFGSWVSSDWALILTLIVGFGSILGIGKYILISISDMKPDVKKIPVVENQIKILFHTMERMDIHLDQVKNKVNKIERKVVKMEKRED